LEDDAPHLHAAQGHVEETAGAARRRVGLRHRGLGANGARRRL
jgi:hypothetical protein